MRTFVELVERYINPEFCPYPEYKGKPYYSIKYIENGEEYVGYSTYSLRVMSEFLKKYFISPALEKQEQTKEAIPHRNYQYLSDYWCECGWHLGKKGDVKFCADCGRRIKWD